jgi:hypothetical protein
MLTMDSFSNSSTQIVESRQAQREAERALRAVQLQDAMVSHLDISELARELGVHDAYTSFDSNINCDDHLPEEDILLRTLRRDSRNVEDYDHLDNNNSCRHNSLILSSSDEDDILPAQVPQSCHSSFNNHSKQVFMSRGTYKHVSSSSPNRILKLSSSARRLGSTGHHSHRRLSHRRVCRFVNGSLVVSCVF